MVDGGAVSFDGPPPDVEALSANCAPQWRHRPRLPCNALSMLYDLAHFGHCTETAGIARDSREWIRAAAPPLRPPIMGSFPAETEEVHMQSRPTGHGPPGMTVI